MQNSVVHGYLTTLPDEHTVAHKLRLDHAELAKTYAAVGDFFNELESQDDSGRHAAARTIVGDFVLRANRFEGMVELRDVTVFGKLVLADSEIDIDLLLDANRPVLHGTERGLVTRCVEADFEKVVCRGDADLSGLSVQKVLETEDGSSSGVSDWASGSGSLRLRDTEVKGDLLLINKELWSLAKIEGELDLSALVANKVVMTGENIQGGRDARVIFERAELSRLEIIDPKPSAIDLTAIRVARWDFRQRDQFDTPGDPVRADQYIEFLRPMRPFDRSVWVAVESDLRNQGRDADADRVYRAMRKQARRYLSRRRQVLDYFPAITLIYGTSPWPLLYPLIAAFVLLALVLSQAANVSASPDLIQAQGRSCTELYNDGRLALTQREQVALDSMKPICERLTPAVLGYSWNWIDGTYLALRHSVPIINLFSYNDWQAAHRPVMVPDWASCHDEAARSIGESCWLKKEYVDAHGRLESIYVDAIASLVSLYAWIAVPISLLFFGAKAIRGQRK